MTRRRSNQTLRAAVAMAVAVMWPAAARAACDLVVDPLGNGTHQTIQSAIDDAAALGPCTIVVRAGTYREAVTLDGLNALAVSADQRIVLAGERGAIVQPLRGNAFVVRRSRFVTVQGFTLTGATEAAVALAGGDDANADVTVASNDIHNNASSGDEGSITVGPGNTRAWIANNLIRNNSRNGIAILSGASANAGPVLIVNNTIVANGWNGVSVGRGAAALLANNLIVSNGVGDGVTGGRWGLIQDASPVSDNAGSVRLLSNMFYRNGSGKADAAGGDIGNAEQTLHDSDADNRTTSGSEGPGVDGCTFDACSAAPGLAALFTGSGQGPFFGPATDSPAIGRGRATFVQDGTEWVPALDVDGRRRGTSGRVDVGYAEARPAQ